MSKNKTKIKFSFLDALSLAFTIISALNDDIDLGKVINDEINNGKQRTEFEKGIFHGIRLITLIIKNTREAKQNKKKNKGGSQ